MPPAQREIPAVSAVVVGSRAVLGAAEGLSCADCILSPHRVEACGDAGGHRLCRRGQPASVRRFWDNWLPHAEGKGYACQALAWFHCALPFGLSLSCSIRSTALLQQRIPFEALQAGAVLPFPKT